MKPLFSTCDICRSAVNAILVDLKDDRILTTEIGRGSKDGCGLCTLLLRAVDIVLPLEVINETGQRLSKAKNLPLSLVFRPEWTENDFQFAIWWVGEDNLPRYTNYYSIVWESLENKKLDKLQEVPTQLTVPHVLSNLSRWIKICEAHTDCSVPNSPQLPKRILYISKDSSLPVKLARGCGIRARYIALSYCWGAVNENTLRTTKATLTQHEQGISWTTLPRTFQDATLICRALDIRYLWIDALAIIQDDPDDWEEEAAKMASIYSNSWLTIAATSGHHSDAGILHKRFKRSYNNMIETESRIIELREHIFKLRPILTLAHNCFFRHGTWSQKTENVAHPLLTRAWAYQERVLPGRILHFYEEELFWECRVTAQCECGGYKPPSKTMNRLSVLPRELIKIIRTSSLNQSEIGKAWFQMVGAYTTLNLTYESDRLPALAGLAAQFQRSYLGDYVAGMWSGTLPEGLLWQVDSPQATNSFSKELQAPSWSWASIQLSGKTSVLYAGDDGVSSDSWSRLEVLRIRKAGVDMNPLGWVRHAILTVRALSAECTACRFTGQNGSIWCVKFSIEDTQKVGGGQLALLMHDGVYPLSEGAVLQYIYIGNGKGLALQRGAMDGVDGWQRIGLVIFHEMFIQPNLDFLTQALSIFDII